MTVIVLPPFDEASPHKYRVIIPVAVNPILY
jgi:hypothetical protein